MRRMLPLLLIAGLGISACGEEPAVCPAVITPGFRVTIVDSLTGEPVSEVATAIVTDGAYSDTLRPCAFDGMLEVGKCGADERPGLYTLTIVAPGYQDWQRMALEVLDAKCGVHTVAIEARLMPEALANE